MSTETNQAAAGTATAEKATTRVRVVTATALKLTGHCSWKFMFDGRMPRDWIGREPWGFAWLEAKGDDYFNPWEWAKKERGEAHGRIVGDDGTARWGVHVFESERGEILSCGFDDSADLMGWRMMAREGSLPPAFVLCMERALFDRLEPVLLEEGVRVEAHHFDGELATS